MRLRDNINVSDHGHLIMRHADGQEESRAWDDARSVVEVHGWVKTVMRERGKIVPGSYREGHNIWTNVGREYTTQRMTPQLPGSSPYRSDLISYMAVGSGAQLEEPGVLRLQTPLPYLTGLFLASIQVADFPLYPVRTTVRFQRTFSEFQISLNSGTQTIISELGLFTNGDPNAVIPFDPGVSVAFDDSSTLAPVAYKAFEPIGKTTAMQLEVSWEIRA